MDIQPGQLVLVKSDFEANQIPIDWSKEQTLPIDQRKTIRHIRVKKNDILLITELPIVEKFFLAYGINNSVTRYMATFLRGKELCFMVTVTGFEDYFEPIDYSENV